MSGGSQQRKVLEMLDGTREDENVPNELPEIARIQEQSYQGLDLDEELDEREDTIKSLWRRSSSHLPPPPPSA
jgi:hypothetical protein